MNPETKDKVIQKQAMDVAQLTLQNTVLGIELDEAKARIKELEASE